MGRYSLISESKRKEVYNGRTVDDMPHNDAFNRALMFAQYKRGQITDEYLNMTPAQRRSSHAANAIKRRRKRVRTVPDDAA